MSTQIKKIAWSIQEILLVAFNLVGMINIIYSNNMMYTKNNTRDIGTSLTRQRKIILIKLKEFIIHFAHFSGPYSLQSLHRPLIPSLKLSKMC